MKSKKVILTTCAMVFCAFVGCVGFVSCSNESDYEFSKSNKFCGLNVLEFLDITTYDLEKMSDEEFSIFCEAEDRMGLRTLTNGELVTNDLSAKQLNISDSLFSFVKEICIKSNEYSDLLKAKSQNDQQVAQLMALSNPENTPDCAIIAVSHIHGAQKTREQIETYCDSIVPNWRSSGGIPADRIEDLITFCGLSYHPVTASSVLSFLQKKSTYYFQNEEVVYMNGTGGPQGHAANLVSYAKIKGANYIYINDYQNSYRNVQRSYSSVVAIFLGI